MRRLILHVLVLICLLLLVSCRPSDTNPHESTETSEDSHKAGSPDSQPQFVGEVFCNNVKYGPTNGASGSLGRDGKLICGHPGAVSEITWKFVARRDGKDIYTFQRLFPSHGETPHTQRKQVAFGGGSVVVFQDEVQRISIIPVTPEQSLPADPKDSEAEG